MRAPVYSGARFFVREWTFMSANDLVLTQVDGAVATITLNRPERHNSLVPELLQAFLAAMDTCESESTVRALVLRAKGESFSTGGDLKGFLDNADEIESYSSELVGLLNACIVRLYDSRLPSIAAVDGQVTGGSLGFVLGSDVAIVTERASFTPYYVEVGFSPDGGWGTLLPQLIGSNRASAVQLLNQTITALQAVDWGLAAAYTESESLDDAVAQLAGELIRKRADSVACTRKLLRPHDLEMRLEQERRAFVRQICTDDAIQGIREFLGVD